tara:strand:- start:350 stop:820 length:471 start_codon:yes stop_codon:yes gene_type:complete
MIDSEGFRANVGIILTNNNRQVFWARRVGMDAWQFPQGGIKKNESPKAAMYRELKEEIGLEPDHIEILNSTNDWLRYLLPKQYIRNNSEPLCIGQKQKWYLLKLVVDDRYLDLSSTSDPEFDLWKWVDFWQPIDEIISFKREVYQQALKQLEPFIV